MEELARSAEQQTLDELIDKHWEYIKSLLNAHDERNIRAVEFHYRTAFAHGWKHHKEYVDKGE